MPQRPSLSNSPRLAQVINNKTKKNGDKNPEAKVYKKYTEEDVQRAIHAVQHEGLSALQASRLNGVPSRTLYDKISRLTKAGEASPNAAPDSSGDDISCVKVKEEPMGDEYELPLQIVMD